jgi:OOP family OmpA-OmpF porin
MLIKAKINDRSFIMLKQKIYVSALCAAIAGVSLAPAAFAQDDEERGWTFGLDYGQTEAKKFCDNIANCDDSDNGPKVEIGYDFNKNWGVELGYTSFGTDFDLDTEEGEGSARVTQKANAITLSAIGSIPVNDWFGVYARLGYARYDTNNNGSIDGVRVDDESGNSPFWGAGVKFNLNEQFAIRVEYQNYRDLSNQLGHKDDVQGLFAGGVYRF